MLTLYLLAKNHIEKPLSESHHEGFAFLFVLMKPVQGFQLFCKVADILLKAPDVNVFLAP